MHTKEILLVMTVDDDGLTDLISSELVNGRIYQFRRKVTNEYGEIIEILTEAHVMIATYKQLQEHLKEAHESEKEAFRREVERTLRGMGVSEGCSGFKYLVEASVMVHEIGVDVAMITKSIYPRIADEYNVTDSIVDHNIRNEITRAWKSKSDDTSDRSSFLDSFDRKPSNLAFIKSLVMAAS